MSATVCDARDADGFGCELADGHEGDHCALWSNRIGKYRKVWTVAAPAPDAPAAREEPLSAEDLRVGLESLLRDLDFHARHGTWLPSRTTSAYYAELIRARVPVEGPQ